MHGIHVEILLNEAGSSGTEIALSGDDPVLLSLQIQCWLKSLSDAWAEPVGSTITCGEQGSVKLRMRENEISDRTVNIIWQETLSATLQTVMTALLFYYPEDHPK
ncbi:MAG: hypothetical protein ACI88C_000077 [Acidimicrobiales bacterium]|jgi:hypothetical protein